MLADRLEAVLAVVYLIYNEEYLKGGDLADEALYLANLLTDLLPNEPEAHGLSALLSFHHARRAARTKDGQLVLLADQDRSLWDQRFISRGRACLSRARALDGDGPYVIQAQIENEHLRQDMDWGVISALYGQLAITSRSPIIELNRAVAVAQSGAVDRALSIVDELALDDYPYYHSTRAELLRRLGRGADAAAAYQRAIALARAPEELRFLRQRFSELSP